MGTAKRGSETVRYVESLTSAPAFNGYMKEVGTNYINLMFFCCPYIIVYAVQVLYSR